MGWDAETLVILTFILLAIGALNNGMNFSTDSALVWGPALFFSIPYAIFGSIASSAPILVPIGIIAFLAYFNVLDSLLGEGLVGLILFSAVIVLLGV